MSKRIPIFFLILLLAGILMGLVGSGWAQEGEANVGDRFVRIWVGDGGSFLGVRLEEVTPEAVQRLSLPEERGALVTNLVPESPAAKAGLQKDDVIVRWNGVPVESARQLRRFMRETPAGRTVRLGVFRNGRETEIAVTLGKRSDHAKAFKFELDKEGMEAAREALDHAREALKNRGLGDIMVWSHRGRLGVTLQNLTPQLAEYFGLKDRSGALITSVRADSPASRAGLKAGDIILAIDGQTVNDPGDARRIIAKKEEGPVEIRVLRDRREKSFTVTLEKREKTSPFFAPEIDVRLDPFTLPDLPYTFVIPGFDAPPPPPLLWQEPEIQAPPGAPGEPVRVVPGVI